MYIEIIKNRTSPPSILLRESVREGKSIRKRTLVNMTKWPPKVIAGFRALLKSNGATGGIGDFEIVRSLPYGHVAATLAVARQLGLDVMLDSSPCRNRNLVLAMIVARVIAPASKLSTTQGLRDETAFSALGELLGVGDATEDELYAAMDWLGERQCKIEKKLAAKHLKNGDPIFCDLTSVWMEGTHCPLAAFGYSRDGKSGKLQIEFSLMCDQEGRPVAVEVFEGNTSDPATVSVIIKKARQQFGLTRLVLVGDRGTLTDARIKNDLKPIPDIEWVSALRSASIRHLVQQGCIQPSFFDKTNLFEITHEDFPGERLMACFNPLLAEERRRKRNDLLEVAERKLEKIARSVCRAKSPLKGLEKIGEAVGRFKANDPMAKHFIFAISDDAFEFRRDQTKINAEMALDGVYVVRTNSSATNMSSSAAVETYKKLSNVERAFRTIKTVDLKVRPIYHRLEERVRAHVFLCTLAYYVEWHMRERLAPILFEDETDAPPQPRASVVAKACRSERAEKKAATRVTEAGFPVHSFRGVINDLATIALNKLRPKLNGAQAFNQTTVPTPFQKEVARLLQITL